MTSPNTSPQAASPEGAAWAFNAPPGWPPAPPGWQPEPGWQPDPSWPPAPPGWEFWLPAPQAGRQADQAAGQATRAEQPDGGQPAGQYLEQPADSSPAALAGELQLQIDGRSYVFQPGELVRIGRAPDNDVLVAEPTVSRQHARMAWLDGGWIYESVGQEIGRAHV
jgi:hypothetical protein